MWRKLEQMTLTLPQKVYGREQSNLTPTLYTATIEGREQNDLTLILYTATTEGKEQSNLTSTL